MCKKILISIICSIFLFCAFESSGQDKAVAADKNKQSSQGATTDFKGINLFDNPVMEEKKPPRKAGGRGKVEKLDPPTEADLKKAVADIKGIYADKYKSTDVKTKRELAETLLGETRKPDHSPAVKYAFFLESAQVSASTGDADAVMKTLRELGKTFNINFGELVAKELAETEKFAKMPADLNALADAFLECYRNADENELFDDALKYLNSASSAARKANNLEIGNEIKEYMKDLQVIRKEYALVAGAFEKLKVSPDDPIANFAAGKFYCFVLDKWGKGLPMLAKGVDEKFKQVAVEDMKDPKEAAAMVQIGDGWWNLGEDKDYRLQQNNLRDRACNWYEKAIPMLESLDKIKVEKKIDMANSTAGVKRSSTNLPKGAVIAFSFEKNSLISRGVGSVISDLSGLKNDGKPHGVKFVKGPMGDAVEFNGKDSYIEVKDSKALNLEGNLTIAMWLNPVDFGGRRNPYSKCYGGEGTMTIETGGAITFFYGSTGKDVEGGYVSAGSSKALVPGKWNHVALVRDMKNTKLLWYFNGEVTSETPLEIPNIKASGANILLGKGYAGFYSGLIDEFAVFNKALSEREVKELYNLGKKGQSF